MSPECSTSAVLWCLALTRRGEYFKSVCRVLSVTLDKYGTGKEYRDVVSNEDFDETNFMLSKINTKYFTHILKWKFLQIHTADDDIKNAKSEIVSALILGIDSNADKQTTMLMLKPWFHAIDTLPVFVVVFGDDGETFIGQESSWFQHVSEIFDPVSICDLAIIGISADAYEEATVMKDSDNDKDKDKDNDKDNDQDKSKLSAFRNAILSSCSNLSPSLLNFESSDEVLQHSECSSLQNGSQVLSMIGSLVCIDWKTTTTTITNVEEYLKKENFKIEDSETESCSDEENDSEEKIIEQLKNISTDNVPSKQLIKNIDTKKEEKIETGNSNFMRLLLEATELKNATSGNIPDAERRERAFQLISEISKWIPDGEDE